MSEDFGSGSLQADGGETASRSEDGKARSGRRLSAFPYPGGKTPYVEQILRHFPEHRRYVEPFAGSGTTCRAAKELGRRFIGIEKQARWVDVARVRCGLTPEDPANVRPDDGQAGLEAYTDGGDYD